MLGKFLIQNGLEIKVLKMLELRRHLRERVGWFGGQAHVQWSSDLRITQRGLILCKWGLGVRC